MGLTAIQSAGLRACLVAATSVGHPWPGVAAAEAAVETATVADGWFTSTNYTKHCNALGIKPWRSYVGPVFEVPTDEFVPSNAERPGGWKNPRAARLVTRDGVKGTLWKIDAEFVHFGSLRSCFQAQMMILAQPRFEEAMQATSAAEFAELVSAKWATNPARGAMVQAIYRSHADVLGVRDAVV